MNRHLLFVKTLLLNGIFYGGVGFLPWLNPYVIHENFVDKIIGFHSYSIYLYISFFFYIYLSFLIVKKEQAIQLSILIPVSAFFASVFYYFFPTTIVGVNQVFISDIVTDFLYKIMNSNDTHNNCLPSLHGAISVICVYYLIKNSQSYLIKLCYVVWALAICWSAIAIRQHLSVDIIAGIIYGIVILSFKNVIIKYVNFLIDKCNQICKKYRKIHDKSNC